MIKINFKMISLRCNSNKTSVHRIVSSKSQQKMSASMNSNKMVRRSTARRKRQSSQHGCYNTHVVTCSDESMSERGVFHGTPRKRGHQHHPRNHGNRKRGSNVAEQSLKLENTCNLPAVALANNCDNNKSVCDNIVEQNKVDNSFLINNNADNTSISNNNSIKQERNYAEVPKKSKETGRPSRSYKDIPRPAAEGSSQSDAENEDPEQEELAKLRCTSERTEVVAERETRRRRRCADYPGLAFGSSIFSSDTMMKFSIIRNELHNIMNTQLKRVRSEKSKERIQNKKYTNSYA